MTNINPLAFLEYRKRRVGEQPDPRAMVDEPAPQPMLDGPAEQPAMRPRMNRVEQVIASTPEPVLPDHSKDAPRGFWGNVMHRLEHIGKGAAIGASRGGFGGMVAGAIGGGVNPEFADRMEQRFVSEPYWQQRRRMALQEADALGDAERQGLQEDLTRAQIAKKDKYDLEVKRREALAKAEKEDYERGKDTLRQRADLSKEGAEIVSSPSQLFFGRKRMNQGNVIPALDNNGYFVIPSQQQQDARKTQQVQNESRARNAAEFERYVKERKLKLQDFENEEAIRQSYKDASDKLDLTSVPTVQQFESAKQKALGLSGRAENARNALKTAPEDKRAAIEAEADKLQTEADAAKGEMWAIHSHMIGSGGFTDNSSGGWPGLTRNARTKKGGVTKSPSPSSSGAAKDMSQAVFEHTVKTRFGGDMEKAKAEAKRLGYTIGGQAIQ